MDSPQSDDERLQQADAGEAMLSKKMKLLIIMLSLLLIILLLPLASNHGLPLLKPMGISMLQRLWDAMRFIAMTAAISVGIISTSSQRNDKGFNRSAHLRSPSSTRRSTSPTASSSRESINPKKINNFDMNRSEPPNLSVGKDVVNDILYQDSRGKEMSNLQKSKGKQVMDDFSSAASSHEEEKYGLGSPSKHVHSRWAPSQGENYEKQTQMNSRRRLSAGDAWFFASRIDEEIEEYDNAASASDGFSSGKSLEDSRVQLQKKSSPIDEKGLISNKEIKSEDSGFMNVYASMTDDNYAGLRMRKAAISRLTDEIHDANGQGHRRSSSVDRRRPIHYDGQGPDRPGLKQILMDVSEERALNSKLSNLSSATGKSPNVHEQTDRPHSVKASISSTPNATSPSSMQQSMKATVQHHTLTATLPSDLKRIVKHSDTDSMGSYQVVHHKQQEAIKMGTNQILQKQADNAKMVSNEMVQSKQAGVIKMGLNQTHNQIRQQQDDAMKGPYQRSMQADMRSNRIVQSRDNYQGKVGTVQIKQEQDDHQAKVSINKTMQKQADAQTLRKADARMGSEPIWQMQLQGTDAKTGSIGAESVKMQHRSSDAKGSAGVVQRGDQYGQEHFQSTLQEANMSSRSKLLRQISSKHSRSALNLEQLEQIGNTLQGRPPASSSAKRKKSFSCDFGDGFSPDWLRELEPPPPPGFNIDQQNLITSPTEANQSHTELNNDSSSTVLVQSLLPWRSSVPIDISTYPRAASPVSHGATGPAGPSSSVNQRADEFISKFNIKLIKQRQESLERQRRNE